MMSILNISDNCAFLFRRINFVFIGLTLLCLSSVSDAAPIFVGPYDTRGDLIGTALEHGSNLEVHSQKISIDFREWLPKNEDPVQEFESKYVLSSEVPTNVSLFSVLESYSPRVTFAGSPLVPSVTQLPVSQVFYSNSFRSISTKGNPLAILMERETLSGYAVRQIPITSDKQELSLKQSFALKLVSSQFVNRYGVYLVNPQWQSSDRGKMQAWELKVDVMVPRSWRVSTEHYFSRVGDVVTFVLLPSDTVFSSEFIPPHPHFLYKLIKTSLWFMLGFSVLLSGGMAYIFARLIEKSRLPPRVGMLTAVVIGMGMHWYLSQSMTLYLESEADIHHLSLKTFAEISQNYWTLNFYGAILTALISCFVFLRTLEIPFFNTIEEEDIAEDDQEDQVVEDDFSMDQIENDIPPPDFSITASEDSEEEVVE